MNSSPTLNALLVLSHLSVTHVSLQRHDYKDAKKWSVAECSEYGKIRKNKQTNEAAQLEESGYDIENQSAHTHLVSGL